MSEASSFDLLGRSSVFVPYSKVEARSSGCIYPTEDVFDLFDSERLVVARFGRIDRSHSPRLPRVSFKRHFGALMTQALCAERGTPDWRGPATSGSGPLALATPCADVPGRYAGPSNFQSRVAHPRSWDIGPSTSAAQTSLNMVHRRPKARPFGLSTIWGLQDNGRPSPKGTALGPGSRSIG